MPEATRPTSITCVHCRAEKQVGRSGPIPTYCSAHCRSAAKYQRTRVDGRYEAERATAREKTRASRLANARPCPYCNAPMENPRRKQCGQPECKRAFNADRMRGFMRAYRADAGERYGSRYSEKQREYHRLRRERVGHWRKHYPEAAAAGDARRRMRIVQASGTESFSPLDVHTRDKWTCQLCHLPIDPSNAWPHSMSPSVDHIIPLSRGGAHALSNVQSAHLGCNSRKRDRDMVNAVLALARQAAPR